MGFLPVLLLALSQNSPITNIEEFEIVIAGDGVSIANYYDPVRVTDPTRAYIYNNGFVVNGGYEPPKHEVAVYFLSPGSNDTVTAQTKAGHTSERKVYCQLVEWAKWAVVDVQHGTATIGSGSSSQDSSLSRTVDSASSAVIHTGQKSDYLNQHQSTSCCYVTLATDGTKVTGTRLSSSVGADIVCYYYYSVIQWTAAVLKSRQQVVLSSSGSVDTWKSVISPVVQNNSIMYWGGQTNNAFQESMPDISLEDETNLDAGFVMGSSINSYMGESILGTDESLKAQVITARCGRVATTSKIVACTLIEFKQRWCKAKITGRIQMSDVQSSLDASVAAFKQSKTLFQKTGHSGPNPFSNANLLFSRAYEANNTTIRTDRYSSGFFYVYTSFNGLEFIA